MKQVILDFPKQFKIGQERAEGVKVNGNFNKVIICGVGGSALPGTLLADMGFKTKIPVFVHRNYGLPEMADANSLIIAISFSGNTEETLSAYQEAIDKNYIVVALCTGGKLEELAKEKNKPIVVVPNDCLQSRFGTGYLVSAVLMILANAGIIENKRISELLEMAGNLKPESFEALGKELASKLVNKIPVVYASNQYKSVARIWKIKFNENSKIMAFWNYFPELNHNEMVGYSKNSNIKIFFVIILKDGNDNSKILKRMEITAELIKESGAEAEFVEIKGKSKMEKIFNCLLLGDWVSYYLALEYGQDPVPVPIVETFKKQLS